MGGPSTHKKEMMRAGDVLLLGLTFLLFVVCAAAQTPVTCVSVINLNGNIGHRTLTGCTCAEVNLLGVTGGKLEVTNTAVTSELFVQSGLSNFELTWDGGSIAQLEISTSQTISQSSLTFSGISMSQNTNFPLVMLFPATFSNFVMEFNACTFTMSSSAHRLLEAAGSMTDSQVRFIGGTLTWTGTPSGTVAHGLYMSPQVRLLRCAIVVEDFSCTANIAASFVFLFLDKSTEETDIVVKSSSISYTSTASNRYGLMASVVGQVSGGALSWLGNTVSVSCPAFVSMFHLEGAEISSHTITLGDDDHDNSNDITMTSTGQGAYLISLHAGAYVEDFSFVARNTEFTLHAHDWGEMISFDGSQAVESSFDFAGGHGTMKCDSGMCTGLTMYMTAADGLSASAVQVSSALSLLSFDTAVGEAAVLCILAGGAQDSQVNFSQAAVSMQSRLHYGAFLASSTIENVAVALPTEMEIISTATQRLRWVNFESTPVTGLTLAAGTAFSFTGSKTLLLHNLMRVQASSISGSTIEFDGLFLDGASYAQNPGAQWFRIGSTVSSSTVSITNSHLAFVSQFSSTQDGLFQVAAAITDTTILLADTTLHWTGSSLISPNRRTIFAFHGGNQMTGSSVLVARVTIDVASPSASVYFFDIAPSVANGGSFQVNDTTIRGAAGNRGFHLLYLSGSTASMLFSTMILKNTSLEVLDHTEVSLVHVANGATMSTSVVDIFGLTLSSSVSSDVALAMVGLDAGGFSNIEMTITASFISISTPSSASCLLKAERDIADVEVTLRGSTTLEATTTSGSAQRVVELLGGGSSVTLKILESEAVLSGASNAALFALSGIVTASAVELEMSTVTLAAVSEASALRILSGSSGVSALIKDANVTLVAPTARVVDAAGAPTSHALTILRSRIDLLASSASGLAHLRNTVSAPMGTSISLSLEASNVTMHGSGMHVAFAAGRLVNTPLQIAIADSSLALDTAVESAVLIDCTEQTATLDVLRSNVSLAGADGARSVILRALSAPAPQTLTLTTTGSIFTGRGESGGIVAFLLGGGGVVTDSTLQLASSSLPSLHALIATASPAASFINSHLELSGHGPYGDPSPAHPDESSIVLTHALLDLVGGGSFADSNISVTNVKLVAQTTESVLVRHDPSMDTAIANPAQLYLRECRLRSFILASVVPLTQNHIVGDNVCNLLESQYLRAGQLAAMQIDSMTTHQFNDVPPFQECVPPPTPSATASPSASPSVSRSTSWSASPSLSASRSPSVSVSHSSSLSLSMTPSISRSPTPSLSLSLTNTLPPTPSPTASLSFSSSVSSSLTRSTTESPTTSLSGSPSASLTRSITPGPTPTYHHVVTPSLSLSRSVSCTPSKSRSPSPSATGSSSDSSTATGTWSLTPTASPSPSVSETGGTPSTSKSASHTSTITTSVSTTATDSLTTTASESLTFSIALPPSYCHSFHTRSRCFADWDCYWSDAAGVCAPLSDQAALQHDTLQTVVSPTNVTAGTGSPFDVTLYGGEFLNGNTTLVGLVPSSDDAAAIGAPAAACKENGTLASAVWERPVNHSWRFSVSLPSRPIGTRWALCLHRGDAEQPAPLSPTSIAFVHEAEPELHRCRFYNHLHFVGGVYEVLLVGFMFQANDRYGLVPVHLECNSHGDPQDSGHGGDLLDLRFNGSVATARFAPTAPGIFRFCVFAQRNRVAFRLSCIDSITVLPKAPWVDEGELGRFDANGPLQPTAHETNQQLCSATDVHVIEPAGLLQRNFTGSPLLHPEGGAVQYGRGFETYRANLTCVHVVAPLPELRASNAPAAAAIRFDFDVSHMGPFDRFVVYEDMGVGSQPVHPRALEAPAGSFSSPLCTGGALAEVSGRLHPVAVLSRPLSAFGAPSVATHMSPLAFAAGASAGAATDFAPPTIVFCSHAAWSSGSAVAAMRYEVADSFCPFDCRDDAGARRGVCNEPTRTCVCFDGWTGPRCAAPPTCPTEADNATVAAVAGKVGEQNLGAVDAPRCTYTIKATSPFRGGGGGGGGGAFALGVHVRRVSWGDGVMDCNANFLRLLDTSTSAELMRVCPGGALEERDDLASPRLMEDRTSLRVEFVSARGRAAEFEVHFRSVSLQCPGETHLVSSSVVSECHGRGSCVPLNIAKLRELPAAAFMCACREPFAASAPGATCDSCAFGHSDFPECRAVARCAFNCSGHGECTAGGCRCDPGWFGPSCASVDRGDVVASESLAFRMPLDLGGAGESTSAGAIDETILTCEWGERSACISVERPHGRQMHSRELSGAGPTLGRPFHDFLPSRRRLGENTTAEDFPEDEQAQTAALGPDTASQRERGVDTGAFFAPPIASGGIGHSIRNLQVTGTAADVQRELTIAAWVQVSAETNGFLLVKTDAYFHSDGRSPVLDAALRDMQFARDTRSLEQYNTSIYFGLLINGRQRRIELLVTQVGSASTEDEEHSEGQDTANAGAESEQPVSPREPRARRIISKRAFELGRELRADLFDGSWRHLALKFLPRKDGFNDAQVLVDGRTSLVDTHLLQCFPNAPSLITDVRSLSEEELATTLRGTRGALIGAYDFRGSIDELTLYDKALPQDDIVEIGGPQFFLALMTARAALITMGSVGVMSILVSLGLAVSGQVRAAWTRFQKRRRKQQRQQEREKEEEEEENDGEVESEREGGGGWVTPVPTQVQPKAKKISVADDDDDDDDDDQKAKRRDPLESHDKDELEVLRKRRRASMLLRGSRRRSSIRWRRESQVTQETEEEAQEEDYQTISLRALVLDTDAPLSGSEREEPSAGSAQGAMTPPRSRSLTPQLGSRSGFSFAKSPVTPLHPLLPSARGSAAVSPASPALPRSHPTSALMSGEHDFRDALSSFSSLRTGDIAAAAGAAASSSPSRRRPRSTRIVVVVDENAAASESEEDEHNSVGERRGFGGTTTAGAAAAATAVPLTSSLSLSLRPNPLGPVGGDGGGGGGGASDNGSQLASPRSAAADFPVNMRLEDLEGHCTVQSMTVMSKVNSAEDVPSHGGPLDIESVISKEPTDEDQGAASGADTPGLAAAAAAAALDEGDAERQQDEGAADGDEEEEEEGELVLCDVVATNPVTWGIFFESDGTPEGRQRSIDFFSRWLRRRFDVPHPREVRANKEVRHDAIYSSRNHAAMVVESWMAKFFDSPAEHVSLLLHPLFTLEQLRSCATAEERRRLEDAFLDLLDEGGQFIAVGETSGNAARPLSEVDAEATHLFELIPAALSRAGIVPPPDVIDNRMIVRQLNRVMDVDDYWEAADGRRQLLASLGVVASASAVAAAGTGEGTDVSHFKELDGDQQEMHENDDDDDGGTGNAQALGPCGSCRCVGDQLALKVSIMHDGWQVLAVLLDVLPWPGLFRTVWGAFLGALTFTFDVGLSVSFHVTFYICLGVALLAQLVLVAIVLQERNLTEHELHASLRLQLNTQVQRVRRGEKPQLKQTFRERVCHAAIVALGILYIPVTRNAIIVLVCHHSIMCSYFCWNEETHLTLATLSVVALLAITAATPFMYATIVMRKVRQYRRFMGTMLNDAEDEVAWKRFLRVEVSPYKSIYGSMQLRSAAFPVALLLFKAAMCLFALAIPPETTAQVVCVVMVQSVLVVAIGLTLPYIFRKSNVIAIAAHCTVQLCLVLDCFYRLDERSTSGALSGVLLTVVTLSSLAQLAVAFSGGQ